MGNDQRKIRLTHVHPVHTYILVNLALSCLLAALRFIVLSVCTSGYYTSEGCEILQMWLIAMKIVVAC